MVFEILVTSRRIFVNSETVTDSTKEKTLRKQPRRDRTRASFNETKLLRILILPTFGNRVIYLFKCQINVAADLKTNPSQTKYVKTDKWKYEEQMLVLLQRFESKCLFVSFVLLWTAERKSSPIYSPAHWVTVSHSGLASCGFGILQIHLQTQNVLIFQQECRNLDKLRGVWRVATNIISMFCWSTYQESMLIYMKKRAHANIRNMRTLHFAFFPVALYCH